MQRNNVLYYNPATGFYSTSPILSGGKPVTIAVDNIPGGGQSRGLQRPDVVPGVNPYVSSSTGFWLNPAAFSVPLPGTYGSLGHNALTGPGFSQLDTSIGKQFTIRERTKLELRGEIYNILNHRNFAAPTLNIGGGVPSGSIGGVQPGQAFSLTSASSSFGQLNSTVGKYVNTGTNRQIQVALRLSF